MIRFSRIEYECMICRKEDGRGVYRGWNGLKYSLLRRKKGVGDVCGVDGREVM